jgi:hypothetical protein
MKSDIKTAIIASTDLDVYHSCSAIMWWTDTNYNEYWDGMIGLM